MLQNEIYTELTDGKQIINAFPDVTLHSSIHELQAQTPDSLRTQKRKCYWFRGCAKEMGYHKSLDALSRPPGQSLPAPSQETGESAPPSNFSEKLSPQCKILKKKPCSFLLKLLHNERRENLFRNRARRHLNSCWQCFILINTSLSYCEPEDDFPEAGSPYSREQLPPSRLCPVLSSPALGGALAK